MAARPQRDPGPIVLPIRNSVRALIVRCNRVLLVRKRGPDGAERYALPGGGQEAGELLHQALRRECHEEIDSGVEVLGLLHVADAFAARAARPGGYRQRVEFVFHCQVPADYQPRSGPRPDRHQVAVVWVGLQHLDGIDLRPAGMAALIRQAAIGQGPVYLGIL